MKLSQARKMRDGLLKGDSVMAQAWKELLDGRTGTDSPDVQPEPSPDERGFHTAANWKAKSEAW